MSRTVFILGAGASREAGGPLMADFIDRAELVYRRKEASDAAASFELVFKRLGALDGAHSKATLDVLNIESVFAAFEMARLFGKLAGLDSKEVEELPAAMRRVIVRTLEQSIAVRVAGTSYENARPIPPACYDQFAKLVVSLSGTEAGPASVITFNYDVAADFGFYWARQGVDYCLADAVVPGAIPLMKLHGSINWARCSVCRTPVPWHLHEFFTGRGWGHIFEPGQTLRLNIAERLGEFVHCETAVEPQPVIVPPTWNKTQYHSEIATVWRHAARHLAEAENIFVIGYSLPSTDEFFRYLYALGTISATRLKRLMVIDPDPRGEVYRVGIDSRRIGQLRNARQRWAPPSAGGSRRACARPSADPSGFSKHFPCSAAVRGRDGAPSRRRGF
jgi:hypothetical protein